ncbi:MAG: Jag N-terminal domain-containing protein [Microthrixaceae bacterium]|nr:Jag N-terminal domain-containing protein [Microthrixaceae bacterium]
MEWIELTGKTIDEAREEALDRLGVHESEAEVEVLEHPSVSMFGRVKSLARIRARVAPVAAPAKEERRRGGGRNGSKQGGGKPSSSGGGDNDQQRSARQAKGGGNQQKASGGSGNKGRSSGGQRGSDQRQAEDPAVEPMAAPEVASTVEEFLSGLFAAAGHEVTTSSEIDGDRVDVSVDGAGSDNSGLGVMVGRRGATADAILELSKAVMLKVAKGGTEVRLGVDVAGYRTLRRETLEQFGTDLAQEVADSGEPMVLESMGSIDRKIVHDAANAVDGVSTESEGQGRDRRVVIKPA